MFVEVKRHLRKVWKWRQVGLLLLLRNKSTSSKFYLIVCVCRQVPGRWGPSLNFQTAPRTPPLWQCSFWTRGPPCQGSIWNSRAADTGFLSTRRGLPQVWGPIAHLEYHWHWQRSHNSGSSVLSSGRYMADCWGDPALCLSETNIQQNSEIKESTMRGLLTTRVHLSTGLWDKNLTARKQHWVLNTVKNENNKNKKKWAFRKRVDIKSNTTFPSVLFV